MKSFSPIADGTVKLSGGDQVLRTSYLIRDGDSDSSPTPFQDDSTRDDAEAENDFWTISGEFIYRHHVEHRVKLYVPREEFFLCHWNMSTWPGLQIHRWMYCWRKISTIIGTLMEIENWQIRGQAPQDSLCWMKKPPDGYTWSGERQENKRPPDQTLFGLRLGKICLMRWKCKEKAKVCYRETEARQCKKFAWYLLHWSWWWGIQKKALMKNARRKLEVPMPAAMPCKLEREKYRGNLSRWKGLQDKIRLHCWGRWIYEEAHGTIFSQERWRSYCRKKKNSLSHNNLVHKFIPMPQAMEKKKTQQLHWRKNGKNSRNTSMAADEVRNKKEVIAEARNEGRTVHFASLMDLCHLKNS